MSHRVLYAGTFVLCALLILLSVLGGCARLGVPMPSPKSKSGMQLVQTGSSCIEKGRRAEALATFERAASSAPKDFAVMMRIIAVLQAEDMQDESIGYITDAIELSPGRSAESRKLDRLRDSQLYTMLGDTYFTLGRDLLARDAYRQAIDLDPRNALALNNLGYQCADANIQLTEALSFTERAAQLDPKNGSYADSLGWAYFRLGKYDKALEALKRAADLAPSEAEVRYHLGMAWEKCGNAPAARIEYLKALKLSPGYRPAKDGILRLKRQ